MEFQIPQFIEQKPKIVGPLTLGQFLYVLGAAGVSFISYQIFTIPIWIFISLVTLAMSLTLAFVKVNGEPLSKIITYYFKFISTGKVYTWQRKAASQTLELDENAISNIRKQMSIQEKLKSLSLKVTLGKIFKPIKDYSGGSQKYEVVSFITGEKEVAKRVDYKQQ